MRQHAHYYFINLRRGWWKKPFACTGAYLKKHGTFDDIRHSKMMNFVATEGRHFSFLMDAEAIANKIKAFSHTEFDKEEYTNIEKIKERMEKNLDPFGRVDKEGRPMQYELVPVDETYPLAIRKRLNFWKKYIKKRLNFF